MNSSNRDVAFLLGLPFNVMTMDETIEDAVSIIESRKPGYMITANVDFIAQARNDSQLREILFHADRAVCDGMPLVWLSRMFKPSLPERVAGSDMVFRLFEEADKRKWKVYFLGSDNATLETTSGILNERYPAMDIVGTFSPPFGPVHAWPNKDILASIRKAKPDLLLVAVGCPKQEYWIAQHFELIDVPLSIGIGASLDFVSGTQVRAPKWLQKIGMEWSWRLITNPKRLAKRYIKDFYYLFVLTFLQWQLTRGGDKTKVYREDGEMHDGSDVGSPVAPVTLVVWRGNVEQATLDLVPMPDDYDAPVLLQMTDVSFMDSSGIGRLAKVARLARQADVPFGLLSPSNTVRHLIKAMRLETQFPMFDSQEAALHHFQSQSAVGAPSKEDA
jgi:bacterial polymer biosynthesis proteins, WecB/TagA/CpsF family